MRIKNTAVIAIILLIAGAAAFGYLKLSKALYHNSADNAASILGITTENPRGQSPQAAAGTDEVSKNTKELLEIVDQQDPLAALHELAARMQSNPVIFANCHGIAHEIGHEAYKKYKDFITALKYQDSVCSDGYLHGIIEQRFFYAPDVSNILSDMKTICNGSGVSAGRCFHGIGHGIMYYTANDLKKSLTICDSLAGMPRGRCDEGVFMENFLSDQIIHPSTVDKNNPFYPCTIEASGFKPYCYFYAPIFFLSLNNNDYVAALKWCDTAEPAGIVSCIRGVGSLAMKYNINDPKYVESICDQVAKTAQAPSCIDGLVSYYLTFYDHLSKASQMCLQLETKNQPACNAAVRRRAQIFVD
jgi:hypothetical protein